MLAITATLGYLNLAISLSISLIKIDIPYQLLVKRNT